MYPQLDVTNRGPTCVWGVSTADKKGRTMNEILILGAGYTGMAATTGLWAG